MPIASVWNMVEHDKVYRSIAEGTCGRCTTYAVPG